NPPFVSVDSSGAVYIVYSDESQAVSTIELAIAADGKTFAAPKAISSDKVSAFAPQIAIDNNDNVFVTFYDRFGSPSTGFERDIIVIKSTDKGNSFGPQINVSNNPGQSEFSSLILDNQGRVSVVWEDTTGNAQRDVFAARSFDGGATFDSPINLSANLGVSFGAFGGADGNGNLFIGWTDDSGANTDVFVASLSPSSRGPADFTLTANPLIVSASQGGKVNLAVNINRLEGFNGNVTVSQPD